jgi:hypothetical protein
MHNDGGGRKMTTAQKIKQYDELHNEGGDGYNPHRDRLDSKPAVLCKKTDQEKIGALHRRLERECGSIAKECGTYDEQNEKSILDEINVLKNEIKQKFLEEWTIDITRQRRVIWNDMARAGKFSSSQCPSYALIRKQEQLQGWTMVDLKKAVELHDLAVKK